MSGLTDAVPCRRCGRPVRARAAPYETFERRHYACFPCEFGHDPAGPDQDCGAGGCPSGALGGGRDMAAATARRPASPGRRAPGGENQNLPACLQALAAWLDGCGGCYADHGRVLPSNAWVIINDALQAATSYEQR